MDREFLTMILKLLGFFPFIILSIYVILKYSGNKIQGLHNGKYIKIYERVQLSKENSILVVKIGDKAYVISNSSKGVEILMSIDDEEFKKIESNKSIPEYNNFKEFYRRFRKRKD